MRNTTVMKGYLTDRIVTFSAVLKRRFTPPSHGREMACFGFKTWKQPSSQKDSNILLLIGKQRHLIISFKGNMEKLTLFTLHWRTVLKLRGKEGEYSTRVYTDKLISYIGQTKNENRPFFFGILLRIRLSTGHFQVDEKYWKKYERALWMKAMRPKESVLKALKKAGMTPEKCGLTCSTPHQILDPFLRGAEKGSSKMSLYAGMWTTWITTSGDWSIKFKENRRIWQYANPSLCRIRSRRRRFFTKRELRHSFRELLGMIADMEK